MSLYEVFFEMEINICDRFPALSPFDVRRTKGAEVFLLMRRLNNYSDYQKKDSGKKKVIRKKAGDDWF